jgi:hypothetical protein
MSEKVLKGLGSCTFDRAPSPVLPLAILFAVESTCPIHRAAHTGNEAKPGIALPALHAMSLREQSDDNHQN